MTAFGRSADIRVRFVLQDPAGAFERSGNIADCSHGHAVDLKRELLEQLAEHVAELVQPKGAARLT